MITNRVISYAQNREDLILSGFFDDNEKGFYIDVGANEPTHESVTKYFYDRGWHGINIEPIPELHKKLSAERPRDINLEIGIGDRPTTTTLHHYPEGNGLSTMSDKMALEHKTNPTEFTKSEHEIKVKVLTLKEVLSKHAKSQIINFMKVDVEGFEYQVLKGNDWQKYRPQVICIEANHVEEDWRSILRNENYSLVFFDGLNEYYADGLSDRAQKFDYIQAIIFNEPIVNFRLLEDFNKYEEVVGWLEDTNRLQKEDLATAHEDIRRLQEEIKQITPLKRHIQRSVKHKLRRVDKRVTKTLASPNKFKPKTSSNISGSSDAQDKLEKAHSQDRNNFEAFNKKRRQNPALFTYKKSKRVARKALNGTRKIRGVKSE